MNILQQAKMEISQAWEKAKDDSAGIAFGKKCYEWEIKLHTEGESLYPLLKELGVRPTNAHWWISQYKRSAGLEDIHKEKRPNRSSPSTFGEIQTLALRLLLEGFKALSKKEPDKQRALQAAKDWAQSRLSRLDL